MRKKDKNLFDFVDPSFFHGKMRDIIRKDAMRETENVRDGEQILILGCGDVGILRKVMDAGAECLGISDREEEVINARRIGIRALLGNVENLEYKSRFDQVFMKDHRYRIYFPERAIKRLVDSLKNGGKFKLELPIEGNLSLMESSLRKVMAEEGFGEKVEYISYPTKEKYEKIFSEMPVSLYETLVCYRSEILEYPGLRIWLKKHIGNRMALLSVSDQKRCLTKLEDIMKHTTENISGDMVIMEYVFFRVAGEKNFSG